MHIVKELAHDHGGTVGLKKQPNQGCIFCICLPKAQALSTSQDQQPDYALPKAPA